MVAHRDRGAPRHRGWVFGLARGIGRTGRISRQQRSSQMRTLPIKSLLAVAASLLLVFFAPAAKAGDVVDQLKQVTA